VNDTQLLKRLAEANAHGEQAPLPETIWTNDLALREIERRTGMDSKDTTNRKATPPGVTQQIEPSPSPKVTERLTKETGKRRWSGALVGAVAFAVVVIVVGAVVLLASRGSDELGPATPVTTQAPPTSEPTKIYDGNGCSYDGATEFDLNSEVTFTFINESDTTRVGFVVWTVPDGTTAEEILEKGIGEVTETAQGGPYEFWEAKFPPTQRDTEYQVTVTLDRAGLYSVNCFPETGAPVNTQYATIITVNG